jgi:hypothetical protein
MAFMILSKENWACDPSRFVMVKFLISIVLFVNVYATLAHGSCPFWETFSPQADEKLSVLEKRNRLQRYKNSLNQQTIGI